MAKVYSSVSDFVLFPRDQTYMAALDPRLGDNIDNMHYSPNAVGSMHRHGNFSGQSSTSYESYPPVSAYSSGPSAYFGAQNMPYETQKGNMGRPLRRQTPSGSPSPSISQAFDHPPSSLSSASGASAQSTASSTDGSPYASATHVLPYEDKWPGPLHGLGIAPGIVSSESFTQDSFPSANFESDLMLDDGKFPNYVGECEQDFSSSVTLSQPLVSSVFSRLAPQKSVPAFFSRPLALETTTACKGVTIDSILEEANSKIQKPMQLVSPISAASVAASPPQQESSFKAPLTPSSAVSRSPSRATSPQGSGNNISLGTSIIPLDDVRAPRSPQHSLERYHPCVQSTSSSTSQHQVHCNQDQSPFFRQSSGRFVAPLESSCRFSLLFPFSSFQKVSCVFIRSCSHLLPSWPLAADFSNLHRSFSYPTIRHTYRSQQFSCIISQCYSRISSFALANISATLTRCVGGI